MFRISTVAVIIALTVLASCRRDKYSVDNYFDSLSRDSLVLEIIKYVYVRPVAADWRNRWDAKFESYYKDQLPKFRLVKYYIDDHGLHYFYMLRPARSPLGNLRGVGGMFRRDSNNEIIGFREVYNTPVSTADILIDRGGEMFHSMVKNGNVNDYLKNPDFVEWPDKTTYYDTIHYEWLVKPGL